MCLFTIYCVTVCALGWVKCTNSEYGSPYLATSHVLFLFLFPILTRQALNKFITMRLKGFSLLHILFYLFNL